MKLSEKGYDKVYEKCTYRDPDNIKDDCILIEKGMNPLEGECTLDELEFEPDDFEDVVVLTVEEAKTLLDMGNFIKSAYPEAIVWRCAVDDLKERIEQVEKRDE